MKIAGTKWEELYCEEFDYFMNKGFKLKEARKLARNAIEFYAEKERKRLNEFA